MQPVQKLLKILEWTDVSDKESALFLEALTHRSAVNEKTQYHTHNERLEFLGDAVLELITTKFLFERFNEPEGMLTSFRAALVRGDHLAEVAHRLELGACLVLSRGEARSGGATKDYLIANAVEALIGAIYLSRGMDVASHFVHKYILSDLDAIIANKKHVDAKSEFQELTQGKLGVTPHYELVSEAGKDHEKSFVMAAYLEDKKVGEGAGGSKKDAEIAAAANALEQKDQWLK